MQDVTGYAELLGRTRYLRRFDGQRLNQVELTQVILVVGPPQNITIVEAPARLLLDGGGRNVALWLVP